MKKDLFSVNRVFGSVHTIRHIQLFRFDDRSVYIDEDEVE